MMLMPVIFKTKQWRIVSLAGLLVGCQVQEQARADHSIATKTESPAAVPATDAAALRMQVVLSGPDGAASRAVAHRSELPTGAHVGLRLESEGDSLWFYTYHRGPDGKLEALSPEPVLVSPGVVYELPAGGLWYQLMGPAAPTAKETFYAVASRAPLGDRLAGVLATLPDEREPPPISSTRNRFPGPSYRRSFDRQAIAILSVSLLQIASPP